MSTKSSVRASRYFPEATILLIVSKVISGVCRKQLCRDYGIGITTLQRWIRRYGPPSSTPRKYFSQQERRSIVRQIEQGQLSLSEARHRYNVRGESTIRVWMSNFRQQNAVIPPTAPVDMKKKTSDKENEEIKALKKALAESQLKVAALETLVDVAERELKIDIRKKSGARQSPK